MDCPNEARSRRLCKKTRARIGHRSLEVGHNPVRNMGGDYKISETIDEGRGGRPRVVHPGPTLACGVGEHLQYCEAQGKKKMANEIMHLQLKASYKQNEIKLKQ